MKVFITSDIEGTAGFAHWDEGTMGNPEHDYFRHQMTLECAAACKGAIAAGADEILVKDSHGTARNIKPEHLPECVRLTRGSTDSLYAMVSGLEFQHFDACIYTGFHSGVASNESPVAHTFNLMTDAIILNEEPLSEFWFDAISAASLGVPSPFICGDSGICAQARRLIPGITTVETLTAFGAASTSIHPALAVRKIKESVYKALSGDISVCLPALPKQFVIDIRFKNACTASFNRHYPGIVSLDSKTLRYESSQWIDVLRMVHFVLDK